MQRNITSRITHRISFSFTGMVWLHFCQNCEEQLDFSDSYCPSCKAKIAVEENNKTKKELTGYLTI